MPMAIPLVAAAFEAYAGATAIAAGVEGLAAVAAGLEVAGAALTIAGTLTGNKTLSMIGSVAGLGGGALNLADSLGSGALTVDTAGSGVNSGAAGLNQAADSAAADLGGTPSSLASAADASGAAPGLASSVNPNLLDTGGMNIPGNAPGDALDSSVVGSAPTDAAAPVVPGAAPAAPGAPVAPSNPGYAAPGASDAANAGPDYGSATGAGAPGSSAATGNVPAAAPASTGGLGNSASSGTWWDQVGDALKGGAKVAQDNPALTKVAGGLIQGGMNYYGNQQLAESNLQRAMKYQDWVRQRYSDSVKNLSVPQVQVTRGPSSGIIAGAQNTQPPRV